MGQKWYQKATVQAAAVAGMFGVLAVAVPWTLCRNENERLHDQIRKWRFSEALYKKLPGDIDFIARGIRVDKKEGAQMSVLGPGPGDRFLLQVTSLTPTTQQFPKPQEYVVEFAVTGSVNMNMITPGTSGPILVRPQNLAGPFNAGSHEFYLFVERVQVDYVYLTVARRPLNMPNIIMELVRIPFGIMNIGGKRPEPILLESPEEE